MYRTRPEIEAELIAIRGEILLVATSGNRTQQYSIGGRQISFTGASKLAVLYAREKELEWALSRLDYGGGIRLRYARPT